ncbi:hypothetical protein GMOD_00005472 [Pyrenophora seminiperda CCB06]|uniref:Uncharacterized protein n=1 Tax=Pyrenophora seminiperda CCB06 TaxID=1302712 RepID=A0A3M7LVT5_9PLEO|nr:hypothetical protein GMOD_00005472 [Pyrenophora seminiperda CCB06]
MMTPCRSSSADACRVLLRVRVTDIPGSNQMRFHTLGNDFCQHHLGRPIRDQPSLSGYDHPHIPGDFDSDKPLKRWFLYDFNVEGPLTKEETLALPHEVYVASRQGGKWVFIPKSAWIEKAKSYSSSFIWGGRKEQKELSSLKEALS